MSVLDDVKSRLDIVDVVSSHVALKKAGRNFKAPCPFHTEKTPSFIVNPERQSWHCFGACSTGGDVFSFVMRAEGVQFGDALRSLAERAGVSLSENRQAAEKNDALYQVNQVTARFYQDLLASEHGKHAMEYLDKRGVNEDARIRFGLGLSPQGWDGLKTHLLALGITEEHAVEAGVLHRRENGNTFDFFRGRLMFPIQDRQGHVVGFGGRALDDSQPKYLNTGQTTLFNKQDIVYSLHLANSTIRAKDTAIIVEGYMDVIAAHQHGYTNVVASMGTALTENQVSQLKSLAKNFVLALDADTAGQEATLRSLESSWRVIGQQQAATARHRSLGPMYQRDPITLKIAALPEGRDPDDLIREDAGEWERLTENSVPLMDYLIPAVVSRIDISTGQGKTQVVETLLPSITAIDNDFDQDHYLNKLAVSLGVSIESVKATIGGLTKNRRSPGRQQRQPGSIEPKAQISETILTSNPKDAIEDFMLTLLLQKPDLKEQVAKFNPEIFNKVEVREVFTRWLSCSKMDELFESLDEELHDYVRRLIEKEIAPTDRQESQIAINQCLQRLERKYLQQLQENLLAAENPNDPPPRELESAITNVNARLKELFTRHV